ncbi:spermidine synthase [Algibacillus agarilyticus]|uniref:spermidine synthase n=1 Tax=Algibacillus agarilyticus TaxID=2234133 RepID=UPI001E35BD11|nr:hypothetical protein [Algibacillus agarilyticus]
MPDSLLAMKIESSAQWQVNQNVQYRWLTLNGTVQSVMGFADQAELLFPHQQPLIPLLCELPLDASVLEVGLGGGSHFRYLKTYYPQFSYKVVDPSLAVLQLFQDHFNPDEHKIHCVLDTGLAYLEQSSAKYNLIISDIYSQQASSMNLLTRAYCQQICQHLAVGGYLYINFMPETRFELNLLQAHFSSLNLTLIKTQEISGYRNCILIYQHD